MPTYAGGCHCGAVRVEASPAAPIASLLDCNCSICTKKGILHVGLEPSEFRMLQGEEAIETYRFNTRVAEHNFCRHCGIHIFTRPRNNPGRYTVNARCLDDFEAIRNAAELILFNGQNHPKDRL